MMRHCASLLTAAILASGDAAATDKIWAKGNLHTHTTQSDGNASPQEAADIYRKHGYHFLAITDHNVFTDPKQAVKPADGFLMIPGEELSVHSKNVATTHVNAIGTDRHVPAVTGADRYETLQRNIDAVVDAGGLAIMNHPNWTWALDVPELERVEGSNLLEIFNASSGCNNEGDAEHRSVESMWDALLTQGREIYAIACDDTHRYERFAAEEDTPGLGWIVARVRELTQAEVLSAIAKGDFYASTGVELQDVQFDGHKLTVSIEPESGKSYRIQFIGCGGKAESEVVGLEGSCGVSDAPGAYVRAKIIARDGSLAWTQAYRKAR